MACLKALPQYRGWEKLLSITRTRQSILVSSIHIGEGGVVGWGGVVSGWSCYR